MRRREFITVLGGAAAAWSFAAQGQQSEQVRRIGVLMPYAEHDEVYRESMASFRQALGKLGWIESRNLWIDYRWAVGYAEKLPGYAKELVALAPDAIFTDSSPAVAALQRATGTIPIVFIGVGDPVALGFASSLARPGGNATGFALYPPEISAKRVELLKQIAPSVSRVAFLHDPSNPVWRGLWAGTETAARSFGLGASAAPIHDAAEIAAAFEAFAREPNGGLIALASPAINVHRDKIIALAAQYRLPAVYPFRFFVVEGGLASYGVSTVEQYRRAASYIDRILRGAKPDDLPIQFSDKFELVINLKTAKALGLDPPVTLLARTDEVIE